MIAPRCSWSEGRVVCSQMIAIPDFNQAIRSASHKRARKPAEPITLGQQNLQHQLETDWSASSLQEYFNKSESIEIRWMQPQF